MHDPVSYYRASARPFPSLPPLAGDATTDVCVVGAGYTGLASALFLRRAGLRVVVLESERVGFGASGRNGGQLTGGQRRDVDWMEAHLGKSLAHELWALGNESRDLVKSLVHELAIDCDMTPGVATVAHRARYVPGYHALVDKLTGDYGATNLEKLDAEATAALLGTRAFFGGYVDWDAAHLHPLDLALGVARHALDIGIAVHERSRVDGFEERSGKVLVRTAHGTVSADHLVLATNGYLGALAPPLASRIMPINNFIVATAPLGAERLRAMNPRRVAAADSRFVIDYFRTSVDSRLLFGGGENYRRGFPRDIAAFVRPYLLRIYPDLADVAIEYAWGGTLAITMNRMPHIGRLSPRVWFAQGYSGHGVALAHLAGKVIAEAIRGSTERFDVFGRIPIRRFPGGRWLRWPGLVLGMTYFALRDRL
jgi:gamma-glutamylputrescine oxidase